MNKFDRYVRWFYCYLLPERYKKNFVLFMYCITKFRVLRYIFDMSLCRIIVYFVFQNILICCFWNLSLIKFCSVLLPIRVGSCCQMKLNSRYECQGCCRLAVWDNVKGFKILEHFTSFNNDICVLIHLGKEIILFLCLSVIS